LEGSTEPSFSLSTPVFSLWVRNYWAYSNEAFFFRRYPYYHDLPLIHFFQFFQLGIATQPLLQPSRFLKLTSLTRAKFTLKAQEVRSDVSLVTRFLLFRSVHL
jgi:hypothetical protein